MTAGASAGQSTAQRPEMDNRVLVGDGREGVDQRLRGRACELPQQRLPRRHVAAVGQRDRGGAADRGRCIVEPRAQKVRRDLSPCRQGRRPRRAPPPPRGQDAGRRIRPAGSGPPAPPRPAPPAGPTRPRRPRRCAGARPAPRGGPDRPALPAPRAARQAGVRCRSPRSAATAPPAPAPPPPATGRRSPNRSLPPPTGPPPAGRRSAHRPRGSRERRGAGAAASPVRGSHRPFRARRTGRAGVARTTVPEIPRCPSQHTSARRRAGVGATTKAAAAIAPAARPPRASRGPCRDGHRVHRRPHPGPRIPGSPSGSRFLSPGIRGGTGKLLRSRAKR